MAGGPAIDNNCPAGYAPVVSFVSGRQLTSIYAYPYTTGTATKNLIITGANGQLTTTPFFEGQIRHTTTTQVYSVVVAESGCYPTATITSEGQPLPVVTPFLPPSSLTETIVSASTSRSQLRLSIPSLIPSVVIYTSYPSTFVPDLLPPDDPTPTPTQTTSSTSTSSAQASSSTVPAAASSKPLSGAAIGGGVVAGVVALAGGAIIWWWCIRKRKGKDGHPLTKRPSVIDFATNLCLPFYTKDKPMIDKKRISNPSAPDDSLWERAVTTGNDQEMSQIACAYQSGLAGQSHDHNEHFSPGVHTEFTGTTYYETESGEHTGDFRHSDQTERGHQPFIPFENPRTPPRPAEPGTLTSPTTMASTHYGGMIQKARAGVPTHRQASPILDTSRFSPPQRRSRSPETTVTNVNTVATSYGGMINQLRNPGGQSRYGTKSPPLPPGSVSPERIASPLPDISRPGTADTSSEFRRMIMMERLKNHTVTPPPRDWFVTPKPTPIRNSFLTTGSWDVHDRGGGQEEHTLKPTVYDPEAPGNAHLSGLSLNPYTAPGDPLGILEGQKPRDTGKGKEAEDTQAGYDARSHRVSYMSRGSSIFIPPTPSHYMDDLVNPNQHDEPISATDISYRTANAGPPLTTPVIYPPQHIKDDKNSDIYIKYIGLERKEPSVNPLEAHLTRPDTPAPPTPYLNASRSTATLAPTVLSRVTLAPTIASSIYSRAADGLPFPDGRHHRDLPTAATLFATVLPSHTVPEASSPTASGSGSGSGLSPRERALQLDLEEQKRIVEAEQLERMRMWRAAEEEREARVRLEREIARRDRARVKRRERRGRETEGEGGVSPSLEVDVGVAGRGGGGKKGKGRGVAREGSEKGQKKELMLDLRGTGTGTAYDETSSFHGASARAAWQPPAHQQHPCLRVGSDTGAYTTGTDALATRHSAPPAATGLRRRRSDESDLRTGYHPPRPRDPLEPEPEPEPPGVLKGKASGQSMSTHFTETLRRIQETPPRRRRKDRVDVHGMRW